jgi:hypothetical protein
MNLRAQISSDSIAISCGVEVHTGSPILALCRALVAEGCNPATAMEVFRGPTLCLSIRAIGEAARLRVNTAGTGFTMRQEADISLTGESKCDRHSKTPTGLNYRI